MKRKQRCCTNCSAWFVPTCHERTCSDECRRAKLCERGGANRSGMDALYAAAGIDAVGHAEPTAEQEAILQAYQANVAAKIREQRSDAERKKSEVQPAVPWDLPIVDGRVGADGN